MLKVERMSPDLVLDSTHDIPPSMMVSAHNLVPQEEPRDLSIKRKLKPVPPPLDLSKRTLELDQIHGLNVSPKSPHAQKNLPLRKRAFSWSSQPENLGGLQLLPDSYDGSLQTQSNESKYCRDHFGSSSTSLRIHGGLSTPQTPHTPHPHSAIPVITSRFNFGDNCNSNGNSCLGASHQGPLNLSTSSVNALPSSLLSPAPSHPSSSSLNSSREELEVDSMNSEYQTASYQNTLPVQQSAQCVVNVTQPPVQALKNEYCLIDLSNQTSDQSNEPVNSPMCGLSFSPTPHQWPTAVWSVFMAGVHVHFVIGAGQITSARLSEDLGQLERTQHQQFGPHGLHLLRVVSDSSNQHGQLNSMPLYCQLYFKPVMIQQQDIIAVAPPYHPFYVHGKGWCSLFADRTLERYNLQCQTLQEGDLCLPPYHPEVSQSPVPVVTPDLTDAMKKFDFNDDGYESSNGACSAPPSATFSPHNFHRSVFLSPPASPSKKNFNRGVIVNGQMVVAHSMAGEALVQKSRRPMNGFMLFAKHHRLKLIQQYPGKDNRAISVLLGAMWKNLPEQDRERFNSEARVQAEERKRIDPDCWKRKRSHSTS